MQEETTVFAPGGYERLYSMIRTAAERNWDNEWASRDIKLIGDTLLAVTQTNQGTMKTPTGLSESQPLGESPSFFQREAV